MILGTYEDKDKSTIHPKKSAKRHETSLGGDAVLAAKKIPRQKRERERDAKERGSPAHVMEIGRDERGQAFEKRRHHSSSRWGASLAVRSGEPGGGSSLA